MTGVSIFFGFKFYQANLWEAEQISWETSYPNDKLQLKIKGRINQSELQPKKICILLVDSQKESYVNGKPRTDKNICEQESSIANLEKDGNWEFKYTFNDEEYRTIRVEKIYNNSVPKNYKDFTIGK